VTAELNEIIQYTTALGEELQAQRALQKFTDTDEWYEMHPKLSQMPRARTRCMKKVESAAVGFA
jgi:hypothetical protein